MGMTPQLWSISTAAVELGRDRRTIAAALRDIPADGQIDARSKGWRLDTILAAMNSGSGGDGKLDLNEEKARLAKEQADRLEMANAQMRRELLARADVDAAVEGAFARVRARLLSLPGKVAPLCAAEVEPVAIERIVRSAVYEALHELSETSVADLCGDGGGVVVDTEAATGIDGKPMGRPGASA